MEEAAAAGQGLGLDAKQGVIGGGPPAGAGGSGRSEMGGPVQTGPYLGPDLLCQRRPGGSGQRRERIRWKPSERSFGSGNGHVRESQDTGNSFFLLTPPVVITPCVRLVPNSVQRAPVHVEY